MASWLTSFLSFANSCPLIEAFKIGWIYKALEVIAMTCNCILSTYGDVNIFVYIWKFFSGIVASKAKIIIWLRVWVTADSINYFVPTVACNSDEKPSMFWIYHWEYLLRGYAMVREEEEKKRRNMRKHAMDEGCEVGQVSCKHKVHLTGNMFPNREKLVCWRGLISIRSANDLTRKWKLPRVTRCTHLIAILWFHLPSKFLKLYPNMQM